MRPAFWIAFPLLYCAVVIALIALAIPSWTLIDPGAAMPEHAILYATTLISIGFSLEASARMTRPFRSLLRAERAWTVLTAAALGLGAALADTVASIVVVHVFQINYPASSFKAAAIGLITGAFALEWLGHKARHAAARPAAPGSHWTMADLVALYHELSRGDRDMLDGALAKRSTEMITVDGSANAVLWGRMSELDWLAPVAVPTTLQEGALAGRFLAFAITDLGARRIPHFVVAAQAGEPPIPHDNTMQSTVWLTKLKPRPLS